MLDKRLIIMTKKQRKIPREEAELLIKNCWENKELNNFDEFEGAMASRGFALAQKTSPNKLASQLFLVAIDEGGGLHTVSRRLNISVNAIRKRFSNLDPSKLPTVEYVLAVQAQRKEAG